MRRRCLRQAGAVLLPLLLVGCSEAPESGKAAGGLAECPSAPATCNSGDRKPGGEITWVVEQGWGNQWNTMRPEGTSYYLSQVLAGTTLVAGDFLPSGTWAWNLDLFATEPRLVSTDPQTAEFVLRPEAAWSDGVAMSADDFRFNWFHNSGRADQCEGCDPADTTGWSDVASIESTGNTVTIALRPGVHDPEWFARLGPSPYPAHVATRAGMDWRTPAGMGAASAYFRDTVPTWSGGPYVIESVVKDQRAVLVPNPRWYGREKPTLTRIVKEVLTTQADWPAALANGEIDGGAPLSYNADIAERFRSTTGVSTALGASGASWEHVELNLMSAPLADLAIRKAILTALDAKDLRARLFGEVAPPFRTNPLFPPKSPYNKDVVTATGFGTGDLGASRKLLSEAGYTGAAAGQRLAQGGNVVPDLRFAYIAGHPTRGTLVEVAQARLAEIGLTVRPVAVPGSNYGTTLRTRAFDLTVFAMQSGPLFTEAASSYYRTGSGINFPGVSDPALDRAADAVLTQTDLDKAAANANEVAERLMAAAAVLPLWDNPAFIFVRNPFVNVRDNPLSNLRAMYNIGAWGVSANR